MIFHPILLQRKKQDPLKRVASVAPLNVASRAGLVGGGAQRRTSLQDLLEGQNCPGGRGHPLGFPEDRGQGTCSLTCSKSNHGTPDTRKPALDVKNTSILQKYKVREHHALLPFQS